MHKDLPGSGDRTDAALDADSLGLHLRIPWVGLNLRTPWFGLHLRVQPSDSMVRTPSSDSTFGFHLRIFLGRTDSVRGAPHPGQKWFGRS